MIVDLAEEMAKLTLIVVGLCFALGVYVRGQQPTSSAALEKRRVAILLVIVLAVLAVMVSDAVLGGESGPIDKATLLFIRRHIPSSMTRFFELVSFSGSSAVLFPLAIGSAFCLLWARRRFEALLLVSSVASSAIVVYVVKTTVGRTRPALWETDWFWGSSFPSGHTLVVAAFATAASLCVDRIWPAAHALALTFGMLWICLVGFSRLVLGVHWPTDVLAGACTGIFIPLAMSVALELRRA